MIFYGFSRKYRLRKHHRHSYWPGMLSESNSHGKYFQQIFNSYIEPRFHLNFVLQFHFDFRFTVPFSFDHFIFASAIPSDPFPSYNLSFEFRLVVPFPSTISVSLLQFEIRLVTPFPSHFPPTIGFFS